MLPRSPLEDPETASHAWGRYWRLMRFMMAMTVLMVIGAFVALYKSESGVISPHFYIATALGITFAMLLMSALMGLVFLSSGTGHDETVAGRPEDEDQPSGRNL